MYEAAPIPNTIAANVNVFVLVEESDEYNVVDATATTTMSAMAAVRRKNRNSEYDYYALSNMYSNTKCNAPIAEHQPSQSMYDAVSHIH